MITAWGRFVIRKFGTAEMSGEWGYCDAIADHDWGFQTTASANR